MKSLLVFAATLAGGVLLTFLIALMLILFRYGDALVMTGGLLASAIVAVVAAVVDRASEER